MRVGIDFGLEHINIEVAAGQLLELHCAPSGPALTDPVGAVRKAVESPAGYPPLWRALTPDDHVTVVVDEQLPHVAELLTPVLEHITDAEVAPEAITLLCPPTTSRQEWLDDLPDAFLDVHVEVHDPTNRKRLAYLATTKQGRRLYLNRTAVDADQVVILGRRGYDPLLGYAGFEGDLYPALSDEATRTDLCGQLSMDAPTEELWPARQEAVEVAWLLGAPFLVQVIEDDGDELLHIVGGSLGSGAEGQRLLDARWRGKVDQLADTVLVSVSGAPQRHGFADLARALACASRVVEPGGRIVLLSQVAPKLGAGATLLRQAETPAAALNLVRKHTPTDSAAAFQWASAAQKATLYVLSGLPADTTEELFAVPLENAGEVQRLLKATKGSCLIVADANKTMAVVESAEE